ncbi:urea amidolyase family protein [Paracoccus ravus]|uniref:5-oxoprolinase subunit B/C family protein n=1 Tax=Paracoccus ravus TaxID=2447760 RepID=UPI00106E4624|nr:urea amidolyase family protein [Paracoccus ravus]
MTEALRFHRMGSEALLAETGSLDAALALFDGLRNARIEGITELVPAAQTVLIRYNPSLLTRHALEAVARGIDLSGYHLRYGEIFDIPVTYDGEDLQDVAEFLGWSVEDLIRRHGEATFTVAFTGFAPGFAYMTSDDPAFDVPRRKTPRVRIPAGSVAIAGRFGGIYPSDSPGGWQLLGRTPLKMWDLTRARAALLTPGDQVRFRDMTRHSSALAFAQAKDAGGEQATPPASGLVVTRADRPALYQDLGRPGHADQGVSVSGAVDRASLIRANRLVGNPPGMAAIEVTFGGFALRTDRAATLAATGAPCPLEIRTADGRRLAAEIDRAVTLDAGDELVLGTPARGMRTYLALRGGIEVLPALGSASTDTLARIGPPPIATGDVVIAANQRVGAVEIPATDAAILPRAEDLVCVDIELGPRQDWFTENGLEALLSQDWQVSSESSRVGMRLTAETTIERANNAELPSEGAVRGAVQVPHSGQPVVFLADHPLTAGYPVIGVVAAHHLDLLGQIPIGARIRFHARCKAAPSARTQH